MTFNFDLFLHYFLIAIVGFSLYMILHYIVCQLKGKIERTVLGTPYGFRLGFKRVTGDGVMWFLYFYWRDKDDINRTDGAKSHHSLSAAV
jgi:hypothetical protein